MDKPNREAGSVTITAYLFRGYHTLRPLPVRAIHWKHFHREPRKPDEQTNSLQQLHASV